eukprot:1106340-Pyramimonas_sp.AAC.1
MATRSGREAATGSTSREPRCARHQRQANQPTNQGRKRKRSHLLRSSPGRVRPTHVAVKRIAYRGMEAKMHKGREAHSCAP